MAGKLSAFFGAQDMTVGNPATNLIRFSTPLLIGNLAQQLYSTVDSIVVGNYVGDSALAAIGASGPIINLLLVLVHGRIGRCQHHGVAVFRCERQKATFAFCRYGDHGNLCGFHLRHGRGPAHYTPDHVCTANTAGYLHHGV